MKGFSDSLPLLLQQGGYHGTSRDQEASQETIKEKETAQQTR
jgi:hypothetical protein